MYIKGLSEYTRDGAEMETALVAGRAAQDGERRTTGSGKAYATVSVKAFGRRDGTAAFLTVKAWDSEGAARLSALRKGDPLLAVGRIDRREYNGKTYTDLVCDFVVTQKAAFIPEDALAERMAGAGEGFAMIDGAEADDGELPF